MASLDDTFDIDEALNAELDKLAAEYEDPYGDELEAIKKWQDGEAPEDFNFLWNRHQPLIYRAGERYLRSTTLPKTAVQSSLKRSYVQALRSYDPDRGRQFKSHLYQWAGRTGRYVQRYSNVGRIPENRSWLIDHLQRTESDLTDRLGRPPSDTELSEQVMISAKGLAELRERKITPDMVSTLRQELRADHLDEARLEPTTVYQDSPVQRQIVFLHGSLNPEQQLVLEHTFDGFGKPVIEDAEQLARTINMSSQKIRAIRRQIQRRVERYYQTTTRL